jgi:drug/metabolite transporter (DMT)-like permease
MNSYQPPLDYSTKGSTPPADGSWISFILGVIAGLVFSLLYYLGMMQTDLFSRMPMAALGAVIAKVVVGVMLIRSQRYRRFGIGLIVSIPLAVLIFVGLCFAALSKI